MMQGERKLGPRKAHRAYFETDKHRYKHHAGTAPVRDPVGYRGGKKKEPQSESTKLRDTVK